MKRWKASCNLNKNLVCILHSSTLVAFYLKMNGNFGFALIKEFAENDLSKDRLQKLLTAQVKTLS